MSSSALLSLVVESRLLFISRRLYLGNSPLINALGFVKELFLASCLLVRF